MGYKLKTKTKPAPCPLTKKEKPLTWLSITDPVSVNAVSLVTMPHAPSSHPSSVAHAIKVLWSVWVKKTLTSVTKPNLKEVSSPLNTQSNTVSLPTGMIWKKSGTTLTTTNSALPQKNAQPFSLKLHSTQKLTVKR